MEIKFLYPKLEAIKPYVDYYYIFNPGKFNLDESYIAYPHVNTPLFFFNHLNIDAQKGQLYYREAETASFRVGIIGRSLQPVRCVCSGCVHAITIVFKPLGLNQFMRSTFNRVAPALYQELSGWKPYQSLLEPLLSESNVEKIIASLDRFLHSLYIRFHEPRLERAIDLMKTDGSELNDIEVAMGLSRKTLLRLFEKHLGTSPTSFRRILRFRLALDHQRHSSKDLTQIAYEAHFADQGHFTREVKKLTGDAPKKFARETTYLSGSPFLMKLKES